MRNVLETVCNDAIRYDTIVEFNVDSKAECDQLNLAHETKTNKKVVLSQRLPSDARYISVSNESLRRYGHSKLSKMAACRQLGFDVIKNSAMWNPHLGGRGVVEGHP